MRRRGGSATPAAAAATAAAKAPAASAPSSSSTEERKALALRGARDRDFRRPADDGEQPASGVPRLGEILQVRKEVAEGHAAELRREENAGEVFLFSSFVFSAVVCERVKFFCLFSFSLFSLFISQPPPPPFLLTHLITCPPVYSPALTRVQPNHRARA